MGGWVGGWKHVKVSITSRVYDVHRSASMCQSGTE